MQFDEVYGSLADAIGPTRLDVPAPTLAGILDSGAIRMVTDDRTTPTDVSTASANLNRLFDDSRLLAILSDPEASVDDIRAAASGLGLCPGLWPFC